MSRNRRSPTLNPHVCVSTYLQRRDTINGGHRGPACRDCSGWTGRSTPRTVRGGRRITTPRRDRKRVPARFPPPLDHDSFRGRRLVSPRPGPHYCGSSRSELNQPIPHRGGHWMVFLGLLGHGRELQLHLWEIVQHGTCQTTVPRIARHFRNGLSALHRRPDILGLYPWTRPGRHRSRWHIFGLYSHRVAMLSPSTNSLSGRLSWERRSSWASSALPSSVAP